MSATAGESEARERLRDYVAYVLTSARGLYHEPQSYGPMRMVDSLERSLALLKELGLADQGLEEPLAVMRENRWRAGSDPEGFGAALDDAIARLVRLTMEEKP